MPPTGSVPPPGDPYRVSAAVNMHCSLSWTSDFFASCAFWWTVHHPSFRNAFGSPQSQQPFALAVPL